MKHQVVALASGWEVWIAKFQFDQWDAFVRHRETDKVGGDELVPGGPFPSQPEARQAGIAYARSKDFT